LSKTQMGLPYVTNHLALNQDSCLGGYRIRHHTVRTPSGSIKAFHDILSTMVQVQDAYLPSGPPEPSEIALGKSFEITSCMVRFRQDKHFALSQDLCLGGCEPSSYSKRIQMIPRQTSRMSSSLRLVPRLVLGGL
jgi:hypothetical protein